MKLMILDGNSLLNRAFYGIRPLTTREGLPTQAVYGFVTTLQRLTAEEQPDALCVAFDRKAPTFRHLRYEGYKANRKGMPEELALQLPLTRDVLTAMQIPIYSLEGWEADDILGTVARRCGEEGWECVLVTGDKDSLQLIDAHTRVKLVTTRMGQTTTRDMTEEAFREEYGFAPLRLIDWKALMGDSSDNIPGVPGIGEKTAKELLQHYDGIDAIYAALPELTAKPAVLRKLREGEELARLSYELATIRRDAPIDFSPAENLCKEPTAELYELFLRLEFTKLIDRMHLRPSAPKPAPVQEKARSLVTVTEQAQAQELLRLWQTLPCVTLYALPDLSAVAILYETQSGEETAALCVFRRYAGDWNGFLRELFSARIAKVSHEVKTLMRELLEQGLPIEGFCFDTALAGYLLDATAGSYTLEALFAGYCRTELPKAIHRQEDAFSPLRETREAEEAFLRYAGAVHTLYPILRKKLMEENLWELYQTAELPLCPVLAQMEQTGIRVDATALREYGRLLYQQERALEQEIYELAGGSFNLNSPKQLGEVLFGRLGLPHGKKTKTGWSTGAEVLECLRWESPIVEKVLAYRQYAKLRSTYVEGLGKELAPDGRIHTNFQMTATATGRLSSAEPNLQNIPTRTELGSELRRMFVPKEGWVLVDADYSQIELRLLAHIAGDTAMQNAFAAGEDIHTATAMQVFGVRAEQVTPLMRRSAKAVNFGIVYGISAFSLSKDIGVSVAEAKAYIESYFATFPAVKRYMQTVVEQAKADGFVQTLYHRRRMLPELKASNFNTRSFGERVALNMPIQGTAADLMKMAMVRVHGRLQKEGLQAKLLLQVHDELILECPPEERETVCALLTEEMQSVASLSVPLVAEAHWGENWLAAKG